MVFSLKHNGGVSLEEAGERRGDDVDIKTMSSSPGEPPREELCAVNGVNGGFQPREDGDA